MTHYIYIACEKRRKKELKKTITLKMSTSYFALGYSFAGVSSLQSNNYTYAPEAVNAAFTFS